MEPKRLIQLATMLECGSALLEDPSVVSLRDFIIEFAASAGEPGPATPARA